MIDIAILIVYGVGYVFAARVIIGHMVYSVTIGEPDGEDIVMGVFFGGLCALSWPVIVPFYAIWRVAPNVLVAKPREVRLRERENAAWEREQEVARREREITRLEQEVLR